ncbi:MAG: tetratricopeptide repeat protein [Fibrobacteraceae bacterium]|nr:tetratricopeptide repeat protein [Fibrobacteraceae bacterium]
MAVTLESLKKIIGTKKKSRLFVWLADLERGAGNLDAAMQILDSGLREYPDMLQAHLIRSVILLEQGNLDAALEACDIILQMQPTCLSALRRKGEIYEKQGDEVSRNKYYRLVHDIDPLDMFWKEEYAVLPVEEPAVEETEESLFLPEDDSSEGFLLMPEEEQSADEDPFQIFNALGQEDAVEEDSLSEALENSLNDALEQVDLQDSAAQDTPLSIDDETMSGSDVSSAISDFFGSADDDFFEEELLEESKPASPFSRLEMPESLEDPEPAEEVQQNFESSFEKSAEVVPEESVELDSAFDSLLGEDELPEESPSAFEKSAESDSEEVGLDTAFDSLLGEDELPEESPSAFEKSAESVSEEVGLDTAFDSLLGEDELPEESPSAFEKSAESASEEVGLDTAFDSLLGEDELPEESPSAFEKSAESVSEEVGLDTAFDSLLGEDELPEEAPSAFEKSAESVSEEAIVDVPEDSFSMDLDEEPTESLSDLLGNTEVKDETGVANAFDTLFGKEELADDDELSLPEAKSVELEIQTSAVEKREVPSELSAEVSSSLDALFGDDDDDLELPSLSTETQVAQDDASEKGAFDTLFNAAEDAEEDLSLGQDKVDFLMSGDSEDEVASALLKDAQASLEDNGENIDEHLNTATLAEIYFEQGLLQKSLDIYQDLHEKNPEDEQIANRLSEVQKACDEKFGNREN